MKTMPRFALGLLSLSAAALCAYSASAYLGSSSPEGEGSRAGEGVEAPSLTSPAPAAEADVVARDGVSGADSLPCSKGDRPAPVPEELAITVKTTPRGRVLSAFHPRHIVALRSGSERRVALGTVDIVAPESGSSVVWESTDPDTLETVRGDVPKATAEGKLHLQGALSPVILEEDHVKTHACRAFGDGASGFVVVCRVNGQAAAGSVTTADSKEGVWFQTGDTTLVRFDLPMTRGMTDAKIVSLEKQGRGTLLRVEASRVPGETEALLAIGSSSREQPHPVRRIVCQFPPDLL